MLGFVSLNHKPARITFSLIALNLKGNSLTTKQKGQRLNLDDLNSDLTSCQKTIQFLSEALLTSKSDDTVLMVPATKKAKRLSEVLGHYQSSLFTPHHYQQVKNTYTTQYYYLCYTSHIHQEEKQVDVLPSKTSGYVS